MNTLRAILVLIAITCSANAAESTSAVGRGQSCLRNSQVTRQDGAYFVSCGAITYMTDASKSFVSKGYHSFTRFGKTEWIGKIGAMHDLLDKDGNFILGSYHEIRRTSSGYIVETGALTFILDTNGQIKR